MEKKQPKQVKQITGTEAGSYRLSSFLSYDHPRLYLYPADDTHGAKIIATSSPLGLGRLEIREASSGEVLSVLQWWGKPFRCVLPLGGGKIATGQWGTPYVKVWDVEAGVVLEEWDTLQGMEKGKWSAVCVHGLSHFTGPSTLISSTLIESLVIAKDIRTSTQAPPPPLWHSFVSCWDMREKSTARNKMLKPFLTRDFIYQIEPIRKGLNEVVMVTSYSDASGKYSSLQRWHPATGDRKKLKKPHIKHQHKTFDSQINCVGVSGLRENGYTLVCGSSDGSLSKWQFVKGDSRPELKLLSGHSPDKTGIQDLTVLEKGVVASVSKMGDVNFWDVENDACMSQVLHHSGTGTTPRGDRKSTAGFHSLLNTKNKELLTYDHNGLVKVWSYTI